MKAVVIFLILSISLRVSHSAIVGECDRNRRSNRCSGANAFWQCDGICIDDITSHVSKATCHVPDTRKFSFRLVAAVDQRLNASGSIRIQNLWIKGAGPGLSWEKASKMTRVQEGHWIMDFNYTYDSNSLLCTDPSRCSLNQKALEFRVYRDQISVDGMLGPNIYVHLPVSNSISGYPDFSPPIVVVHPWFDGTRILTRKIVLTNPLHFGVNSPANYIATIFFPPSYKYNTFKRYPVVITFGKDLKHLIIPLLESMYSYESSIEEAFIFAMHTYKSHTPPYCELNPFSTFESNNSIMPFNFEFGCTGGTETEQRCYDCMTCLNSERANLCDAVEFSREAKRCDFSRIMCDSRADSFLDNIENVFLSEMSVRTLGRIKIDFPKDRISIIGIDGGGLLACYAALSRPSVYKNAACISAPFHWPFRYLDRMESREDQGIGLLLNEVTERMKVRQEYILLHATQKYYIDVGEFDNDYMPIVEEYNYSDWVVQQLKSRVGIDPENIMYFKNVLGGGNSAHFLRRNGDIRLVNRIKLPLLAFLKPEGGPNADHPRSPVVSSRDYSQRRNDLIPTAMHSKPVSKEKVRCEDLLKIDSKTVPIPWFLFGIGKQA